MIRHIRGTILSTSLGAVLVDVGGIGYEIRVALNAAITEVEGDTISFHTYFVVRETSQELYGFKTLPERDMFELLIELPGIGPKSALNIMSQADVRLLEESAERNDPAYLSKLSGIGEKSAEKIVLGLKDKIAPRGDLQVQSDDNDVIDALMALGYTGDEARRALRDMPASATNTKERLTEALKLLGSK